MPCRRVRTTRDRYLPCVNAHVLQFNDLALCEAAHASTSVNPGAGRWWSSVYGVSRMPRVTLVLEWHPHRYISVHRCQTSQHIPALAAGFHNATREDRLYGIEGAGIPYSG